MFPAVHGVVSQVGRGAEPAPRVSYATVYATIVPSGTNLSRSTQRGHRWVFSIDLAIIGVRAAFSDSTPGFVARLWRQSDGVLLASTEASAAATASGDVTDPGAWAFAQFAAPIEVPAGVSVYVTVQRTAATGGGLRNLDASTTYLPFVTKEANVITTGGGTGVPDDETGNPFFAVSPSVLV